MRNLKIRRVGGILYPNEDKTHLNALEIIKNSGYDYAYINHHSDKDDDGQLKKEHIHFLIEFPNPRWLSAISDELGLQPNYLQPIRNKRGMLAYMIHLNDITKYQYDLEEVKGTNLFLKDLEQIYDEYNNQELNGFERIYQYILQENPNINQLLSFVYDNKLLKVWKIYRQDFKDLLYFNK